jgi:hypothetical protein
MSKHDVFVEQYRYLVEAYCRDRDIFERLSKGVEFNGGGLSGVMLKMGRQCFTQVGEHADGHTDEEHTFGVGGVYQLRDDVIVKTDIFPVNNIWHFNWQGQLFRLHEAPSLVGYLGVELDAGGAMLPVKTLAGSVVIGASGCSVPDIDIATVTTMPALPRRVLFFMPIIRMLENNV